MKTIAAILVLGMLCTGNAIAQPIPKILNPSIADAYQKGVEDARRQKEHEQLIKIRELEMARARAEMLRQESLAGKAFENQRAENEHLAAEILLLRIETCKIAYEDYPEKKLTCIDELMRNSAK